MPDYAPISWITVYFVGLVILGMKAFSTYVKYILIKLGKLNDSRKLDWKFIADNSAFFIGTDLKNRAKALAVTPEIFLQKQSSQEVALLARSFRKSLLFMGLSLLIAITTIFLANGRPITIILGVIAAFIITLWGLLK